MRVVVASCVRPRQPAAAAARTGSGRRTRRRPCGVRSAAATAEVLAPMSAESSPAARAMRASSPRLPKSSLAAKTPVGHDDGVQVAEQRAQRVLEHQRVPSRAGGGGDQHRLAVERALLEDVEEGLEQARVGRGEHRGHRDQRRRPGGPRRWPRRGSALGKPVSRWSVSSCASWRSSTVDHLDVVHRAPARGGGEPVGEQPGRGRARRGRPRRRRRGHAGPDPAPRPGGRSRRRPRHTPWRPCRRRLRRPGRRGSGRRGRVAAGPRRSPCAARGGSRRAGRAAPAPSSAAGRRGRRRNSWRW